MSRLIGLVIIVALQLPAAAQVAKNFTWYDQETYRLYLAQEWPQLIDIGEQAIHHDHDYFYLRFSIGVAYYTLGKYRKAVTHFRKALQFNNGDPLTVEYLYYAFVFAGRTADANITWEKYKKVLEQRDINSPNGFITGAYSEGGIKISSENSDGVDNMSFFHAGIEQQLGARINLYQGYSNVVPSLVVIQPIQSTGGGPPRTYLQETKYTFPQNEYYVRVNVPVLYGLSFNVSYHLQVLRDSLDNKFRNQGFEAGIKQSFQAMDIYLGYAGSNINNSHQTQVTGKLTIYPLDNSNLYLQGQYTYHLDEKQVNNIYGLKIGGRLTAPLWLEGYGSYGGVKNFQEFEGFYLYNLPHKINYKFGANGYVFIGQTVKISLGYMLENKEQITESNTSFYQHYMFLGCTLNFNKR